MSSQIQLAQIEEELKEILIRWKMDVDHLSVSTGRARAAVAKAKELRIWEPKYDSFKAWLEEECEITESWAYRLISEAKQIAAIEDAAEGSKKLADQMTPEVRKALGELPGRALKQLKTVSPAKAASAAISAIKQSGGPPSAKVLEAEIAKVSPRRAPLADGDDEPALIALDNEWVQIQKDLVLQAMTPKQLYARFRKAILAAL